MFVTYNIIYYLIITTVNSALQHKYNLFSEVRMIFVSKYTYNIMCISAKVTIKVIFTRRVFRATYIKIDMRKKAK